MSNELTKVEDYTTQPPIRNAIASIMGRPKVYANPITIDEKTNCWNWSGQRDSYGHPVTSIKGRTVRVKHTHFEQKHGFHPKRVMNICENLNCVNPEHLAEKTKENKQFQLHKVTKINVLEEMLLDNSISPELRAHIQLELKKSKEK